MIDPIQGKTEGPRENLPLLGLQVTSGDDLDAGGTIPPQSKSLVKILHVYHI